MRRISISPPLESANFVADAISALDLGNCTRAAGVGPRIDGVIETRAPDRLVDSGEGNVIHRQGIVAVGPSGGALSDVAAGVVTRSQSSGRGGRPRHGGHRRGRLESAFTQIIG